MRLICLLFLLLSFTLKSQTKHLSDLCFIENSEIVILGTSNVTDYSCKLVDLSNNANIRISSARYGRTIKLKNAVIELFSSGFTCDNKFITNDFYKAIKGVEFPKIMVQFHQFTLEKEIGEYPIQENVPSKISINLAGQTNYYSPKLKTLSVASDQLTLTGSVDVLMTDFLIEPPTALLGTVKTNDQIQIDFFITFTFK
jgi:hypothetical protein